MPQNRRPNKPISQGLADILAHRIIKKVIRVRRGNWVCWESTVNVNPVTGYTNIAIRRNGKTDYYFRHRVMYVHYFGEFPAELTIDHLCENPACCNPKHLRPATHAENVLRSSKNPYAVNAQRTECSNGHPLQERSLTESTRRRCKQCARDHAAARGRGRIMRELAADDTRHGTHAGYNYWGCKCAKCRDWQRTNYLAKKDEAA